MTTHSGNDAAPAGSAAPGMLQRLENGAIAPGEFGHREHLEAAFVALGAMPFLPAAVRYARAIERFATLAGARDKFSVTVTLAFLSLMAERLARREYAGFEEFLRENPDLAGNALSRLYSKERLADPLSRRVFLLPDLL